MSKRKFTDVEITHWVELYESGTTSPDIANKYGTSGNIVCKYLRRRGIRIRTRSEVKLAELNPNWGGDNIKYFPLHRWIERRMPEKICVKCGSKKNIDLANKGIYDRNLINWEWLCRRCHMISDGRMGNLAQYRGPN